MAAHPDRNEPDWFDAPAGIPLDLRGPVSHAYDAPAADFATQPVAALFSATAALRPDANALSDGTSAFTYAQIATRAADLAARIVKLVPHDGAIAILLPTGPASVIALLACLAASRVCIVLNAEQRQNALPRSCATPARTS